MQQTYLVPVHLFPIGPSIPRSLPTDRFSKARQKFGDHSIREHPNSSAPAENRVFQASIAGKHRGWPGAKALQNNNNLQHSLSSLGIMSRLLADWTRGHASAPSLCALSLSASLVSLSLSLLHPPNEEVNTQLSTGASTVTNSFEGALCRGLFFFPPA